MNLLLALGPNGINQDLADCYNAEIDKRTPGGQHGIDPYPGPRLSERGRAAARGEEMPDVKGVQHKRSGQMEARSKAKMLDKQAKTYPRNAQLKRQADEAWGVADALGKDAGVAYWDRQGVRRNEETDHTNMVTVVLQAYANRKGLEYDMRTK